MKSLSDKHAAVALFIGFAGSLVYEVWRSVAHAGESKYDELGLWMVGFYGIGFTMVALAWKNTRRGWWVILVASSLLWLLGAVGYNPTILMARNPGFIDHFESAAYMGILMLAIGVALERLRLGAQGTNA